MDVVVKQEEDDIPVSAFIEYGFGLQAADADVDEPLRDPFVEARIRAGYEAIDRAIMKPGAQVEYWRARG
jgi:hypothetical protein